MGIDPGRSWGTIARCPSRLFVCDDDRQLASSAQDPSIPDEPGLTLRAGNLWRCMGRPRAATAGEMGVAFVVDAMEVTVEGTRVVVAADSLVVRRPWWRGGALVGRLLWASNSGLFGKRIILPRAHPGDGEWDLLRVNAAMSPKARLIAWRRSGRGDHLPHPDLSAERFVDLVVELDRRDVVLIDGARVRMGPGCDSLAMAVSPDRWTLHFASPPV